MTPSQHQTADCAEQKSRRADLHVARHRITGKLLHQSGRGMTNVPSWAWRGSQEQFRRLADRHGFECEDYDLEGRE